MQPRVLLATSSLFCCAVEATAQTPLEEPERQAAELGNTAETIPLLQARLRQYPRDTDLLRRLAAAQAAAGRYRDALATIDLAAQLAPADNDIHVLRGRILLWYGKLAEAKVEADRIAADAPGYPDLASLQQAIEAASNTARSYGFSASAGVSGIHSASNAHNTWYNATVDGFAQISPKTTIGATIDYEDRGPRDTRISIRLDRRLGLGGIYVAGSVTPHADFRERWSIATGGERPMVKGIEGLIDVRHAEYASNAITIIQPGLRLHPAKTLAITGRWINLFQSDGSYRSGVSARLDTDVGKARTLYIGAATYPDTEAGVTRRMKAAFAGAIIPLSPRVTLRLAAEYERRDQSYTRRSATVGVGWRFGD